MKTDTPASSMGDRVRQVREERGYTREHLAELANIEVGTLGHIERGNRQPRLETVRKLARALKVSHWWLLAGDVVRKSLIDWDQSHAQDEVGRKETL